MSSKPTLVAVAAHADDAELNAGGALAKWSDQGGAIHILMATDNCSGSIIPPNGDEAAARRLPPAETMAIRRREQEAAAALLGAQVHYLDYPQRHYWDGHRAVSIGYGHVPAPVSATLSATPHSATRGPQLPPLIIAFQQPEHVARLADLLAALEPDLVLTQTPLDLDPEHHAVASMVWQAFQRRKADLAHATLRFWTPGSSCQGGLLDPGYDWIEDISEHYERKLALCRCHASQMTALRLDMVARRAAQWGRRIGVRYAEPFKSATL
ncbi:MAG TPA: PIG-L family deacetylase [Planctomycetota bacterium]|nr:PIG-L family deacetylase [Planctomycetota bacterium]HRR81647.1 PIG-L family deacetylase [Planctomycetota bacterium]HRT96917.1 PIG-L family deacetylase [Planctomycetota bacterium]